MEQESDSPESQFQSRTNPEMRVENPRDIFFLQKDKKEKVIFFFSFEKGFCFLDDRIDNRSPPCEIGDGKKHC
jgi:hypothetical protein